MIVMKNFTVFLAAEADGERERCRVPAERLSGGEDVFCFSAFGGEFCVCLGARPYVARKGEFSYKIRLDAEAPYFCTVGTSYGAVEALVTCGGCVVRAHGGRWFLKAEYLLSFSGFTQKHSILFLFF